MCYYYYLMAHNIKFIDFEDSILTEEQVIDFIEMYYRFGDATFEIIISNKSGKTCGNHIYHPWERRHVITLFPRALRYVISRNMSIGGNHKFTDEKIAMAAVLTHELQHANQAAYHKHGSSFYGHLPGVTEGGKGRMRQYHNRACERDARAFVDDRTNEIYAYFSATPPMRRFVTAMGKDQDELSAVADVLGECSDVTMDDVKDELRASKMLTPTNVSLVIQKLQSRGIEVKK